MELKTFEEWVNEGKNNYKYNKSFKFKNIDVDYLIKGTNVFFKFKNKEGKDIEVSTSIQHPYKKELLDAEDSISNWLGSTSMNEGKEQNKSKEILKKELSKNYEIGKESMNGFSIKVGNAVGRILFEEQFDIDFMSTIDRVVKELKENNSFKEVKLQKDGTIFVEFKDGNDARQFDKQPGLKQIFRLWNVKIDHAVNGFSGTEFFLSVKDK